MKEKSRFQIKDISVKRIVGAAQRRIAEVPHAIAWQMYPFSKENRQRLEQFQNIHQGERCFILANGPSLKETDLNMLDKEVTFGLNRIYLLFDQIEFRPTYFVTINELILEQFSQEISNLDMPKFLNWNRRRYYVKNQNNTTFLKSKMVLTDSFSKDITRPIVMGATVTFVALQLAYYMGFQKVILIGLDHSYKEKGIPSETEVRKEEVDHSHFHPQYFPKGVKWQPPDLLRSEIEFELARKAFEADGREIVDATINGKCQVFEKVNYLSLLNKNRI
jgi:hypothetical protein